MRALAVGLALTLLPSLLPSQPAGLDALYQANRWFEFRDALAKAPDPSPFYRAQLALAFHDWPEAEKQFSAIAAAAADPVQLFETGLALEKAYQTSGRYQDARAMLARMEPLMRTFQHKGALDRRTLRQFTLLRALLDGASSFSDMTVAARAPSRLPYAMVDNQLTLPVLIDGMPANYLVDTGSEPCVMSAAEARRLGLTVVPTPGSWTRPANSGRDIPLSLAIAGELAVGNFRFHNVVFRVTPGDEFGPGIIGLPVLLALQTLRWTSDGYLEFGFPSSPLHIAAANLAFSGGNILVATEVASRPAPLLLDTGSFDTFLFPTSEALPARIALTAGGLRTVLAPPRVEQQDLEGAVGFLGMDVLTKARAVTLDFAAMTLQLEGADNRTTSAARCDLPPAFQCVAGWSCIVKQEDDSCSVDRLPLEPWPGNAINSQRVRGGNCILTAGAACPAGQLCRAIFDSNQSCRIAPQESAEPLPETETLPAVLPLNADLPAILRQWRVHGLLFHSPSRDYTYIEEEVTKKLNSDDTVRETTSETREVMNLYDGIYTRLVRKNGKDLSPEKARQEQAGFDKAVARRAHETPQAKAKREDSERRSAARAGACYDEFLSIFDARLVGTELVSGRPTWAIELDPRPGASPTCAEIKVIFTKCRVKLWIDQQDFVEARLEAESIAPITVGKFLIRLPAGGFYMRTEAQRHSDGAWLSSHDFFRGKIKAMLFVSAFHREDETTYRDYRKFQSDSRLLPLGGN